MHWGIGLLALSLAAGAPAGLAQTAKASKKPTAVASKSSAKGSGKATRTGKATAGKTRKRGKTRAAGPALQAHPEPERYQLIQQALADRGYFKGEANGEWTQESQDALARFQTDKKLGDADGKITSLTLRELGLGPKHELSSTAPPVPDTPKREIPSLNAAPSEAPSEATPPPPVETIPVPAEPNR